MASCEQEQSRPSFENMEADPFDEIMSGVEVADMQAPFKLQE